MREHSALNRLVFGMDRRKKRRGSVKAQHRQNNPLNRIIKKVFPLLYSKLYKIKPALKDEHKDELCSPQSEFLNIFFAALLYIIYIYIFMYLFIYSMYNLKGGVISLQARALRQRTDSETVGERLLCDLNV